MSIQGKHIVISGGGSGVGAELATQFAAAGGRVTILGRRLTALQEVADKTGATPLRCDVTDSAAVGAAIDKARDIHGPVAVAIANAGAAPSAPFHRITESEFQATLAVNLGGVFHLWQATLPDMKAADWGRLIAVASTAGLKGYAYVSPYCAAKHGVVGMTRALAQELGASGVTTNAICPGFIDTPLLQRSLSEIAAKTGKSTDDAARSLLAGNPQKRFVTTQEVAGAALWLCSDAAASMNGHAMTLSGGEI